MLEILKWTGLEQACKINNGLVLKKRKKEKKRNKPSKILLSL